MTSTTPALTLNNGVTIPALGLGVFQSPPEETTAAVEAALRAGYRLIDTAAAYGNEREVGDAVRRSASTAPRCSWRPRSGSPTTATTRRCTASRRARGKLGVEQIDLLILHQALPSAFDRTLEAYRALETLLADGKVRAIGVSNFMVDHLTRCWTAPTVVPAVNQIELHPYFAQPERPGLRRRARHPRAGVVADRRHHLLPRRRAHQHPAGPRDRRIAEAHGKSPAQVMLRWGLQHGRSVIPKSTKPERIAENIDVFDFELTADEMTAIDGLDTGRRGGPEPEAITLEAFGRDIPEA